MYEPYPRQGKKVPQSKTERAFAMNLQEPSESLSGMAEIRECGKVENRPGGAQDA